ncbi:putative efflux protein, MATE family [Allopseudospirillum japonicum]|uniref:Putative efflux protein, MATE family n=1 Tax=Allopseudospirillum japonicum TaxID=64971 RepID=A0A1H6S3U8_9GAMM|nr:MATE family efflux transporter [Allopseudospirillum japonicum]SEI59467.1 putative efflux protein, MATE family [Allopseudospirillum japonicum]
MSVSVTELSTWARLGALWQTTWPMAMGVTAMLSFHLADSIFVSYLGVEPLAALSFTLPLSFLIIGVQVGIGIALTALVSRALGAQEPARAQRLGNCALVSGTVIISLLVVCLWGLEIPLFRILGASDTVLPWIQSYWIWALISSAFAAILYFGYSLLRAHGDTRTPGTWMLLTALINIALDPLFIFGYGDFAGWGLVGAAWASCCGWLVGILAIYWLLYRRKILRLSSAFVEAYTSLQALAQLALPAMLSQMLPPLAAFFATLIVAQQGELAVALWGLATRVEFFSLVLVLALTMSLPPILGRAYGAQDWSSVAAWISSALLLIIGWQGIWALTLSLGAGWIAPWLTQDPALTQPFIHWLIWVPWGFPALGICMLLVSAANALGWPKRALLIAGLRLFACYLPALALGGAWAGLEGLFYGALIGHLGAGAQAWFLYHRAYRQQVSLNTSTL